MDDVVQCGGYVLRSASKQAERARSVSRSITSVLIHGVWTLRFVFEKPDMRVWKDMGGIVRLNFELEGGGCERIRGNGILTANSNRLSHFGRRMSLFLQTQILRRILFCVQEHHQQHINLGGRPRRAIRRC